MKSDLTGVTAFSRLLPGRCFFGVRGVAIKQPGDVQAAASDERRETNAGSGALLNPLATKSAAAA